MLKNMSLGVKLLISFLVVGILPFAIVAITTLVKSSDALSTQAFGNLEGVREIKKAQITQFFAEREGDLGVLVETVGTLRQEAFGTFEAIQEIKKAQIVSFFNERMGVAQLFSSLLFIEQAIK